MWFQEVSALEIRIPERCARKLTFTPVRDGWLEVKKLIEEDVEETDGYRRLVIGLGALHPKAERYYADTLASGGQRLAHVKSQPANLPSR